MTIGLWSGRVKDDGGQSKRQGTLTTTTSTSLGPAARMTVTKPCGFPTWHAQRTDFDERGAIRGISSEASALRAEVPTLRRPAPLENRSGRVSARYRGYRRGPVRLATPAILTLRDAAQELLKYPRALGLYLQHSARPGEIFRAAGCAIQIRQKALPVTCRMRGLAANQLSGESLSWRRQLVQEELAPN